jgi:hypothetical protein
MICKPYCVAGVGRCSGASVDTAGVGRAVAVAVGQRCGHHAQYHGTAVGPGVRVGASVGRGVQVAHVVA